MSPRSTFLALVAALAVSAPAAARQDRAAEYAKFRADREVSLKADDGWLTVAGLHFLNPGENRFGRDPLNDFVIDSPDVPPEAGVFVLDGRRVTVRAHPGTRLTVNGREVTEAEMRLRDGDRPADLLTLGSVTLFVHYSGPRLAIRVRDRQSTLRRDFQGLSWYPPDPAYRVEAVFTPYPDRRVVEVPNILGDIEPFIAVGTARFTLGGREHTMEAWASGQRLWFVFRDLTSGRETYPSARFLYADAPAGGRAVLDFNNAVNPPCAYNPWTTCPLPPPQNRLRVRVEAGERIPPGPARTR